MLNVNNETNIYIRTKINAIHSRILEEYLSGLRAEQVSNINSQVPEAAEQGLLINITEGNHSQFL